MDWCILVIYDKIISKKWGDTMWEYKTEIISSLFDTKRSLKEKCDTILKKHSNEGWELVHTQSTDIFGCMLIFIFKREKKQS